MDSTLTRPDRPSKRRTKNWSGLTIIEAFGPGCSCACGCPPRTKAPCGYQRAERPLRLDGLAAAKSFFAGCFSEPESGRESLWVAHDQARCLHVSSHQGDETGADFPLRAIIADDAKHGSAGILLAHNHPSGDARPSGPDRRATRPLASAAEALDCTLIDHLIFVGDECASFRHIGFRTGRP